MMLFGGTCFYKYALCLAFLFRFASGCNVLPESDCTESRRCWEYVVGSVVALSQLATSEQLGIACGVVQQNNRIMFCHIVCLYLFFVVSFSWSEF